MTIVVDRTINTIEVLKQGTIVSIVYSAPKIVSVAVQGPAGASFAAFIHTQSVASAIWTINHNLGYRPIIQMFDAGGNKFSADTLHVSNNQAQIYLNTAITGSARCI